VYARKGEFAGEGGTRGVSFLTFFRRFVSIRVKCQKTQAVNSYSGGGSLFLGGVL